MRHSIFSAASCRTVSLRQSVVDVIRPKAHRLPAVVGWALCILLAISLAIVNVSMVLADVKLVSWKFNWCQDVLLAHGVGVAAMAIAGISLLLVAVTSTLVALIAPAAAGSGIPEVKGYLNGNTMADFFATKKTLVRIVGIVLVTASGLPVGREGPMVCIGGGIGVFIVDLLAAPYFQRWVGDTATNNRQSLIVDEDHLAYARRLGCVLGGSAGIATAFNAPVGALLYMFEEATVTSWAPESTFRAFICTVLAALCSKGLLNVSGEDVHALVIYGEPAEGSGHRLLAEGAAPNAGRWHWIDLPVVSLLGVLGGVWAGMFTRALVAVWKLRSKSRFCNRRQKHAPVRCVEAAVYTAICACAFALVPLAGSCLPIPSDEKVSRSRIFRQYNCPENEFNGLASLLLNGAEGAVKHLFSRDWDDEAYLPPMHLLLCLLVYSSLAAGVAALAVPMGAFVPSMVMGGLVGRLFREVLSGLAGHADLAHPGVYALMGSAAMLGGFTQMSIAIVVLLLEATHDYPLVAPLMLSVTFARITARAINHRAYDEHLILLKQVPYLEEELPAELEEDNWLACELCEEIRPTSRLSRNMDAESLEWALSTDVKRDQFPVMDEGKLQGIVQRSHLKVLLHSRDNVSREVSNYSQRTEVFSKVFAKVFSSRKSKSKDKDEDGLDLENIVSRMTDGNEESGLPVHVLMDSTPHTIWEDTPIERFYPLFSRLGVAALCVIARDGQLKGILTRKYITAAANHHVKTSRATVVKPFLCMEASLADDNVENAVSPFSTPVLTHTASPRKTDASEKGGEEGVSSLRDASKQTDDAFAEVSVIEMP